MAKSKLKLPKTDADWFKKTLEGRGMSMRQLAKAVGLDPSSMSLSIRGRRAVRSGEVGRIAAALNVSSLDVLNALGVRGSAGDERMRRVPVVGAVNPDGTIRDIKSKNPDHVDAPNDTPVGSTALIGETSSSTGGLDCFNGAVFVIGPKIETSRCVGRLAVVDGRLAYVRRGLRRDAFRLIDPASPGAVLDESATVKTASPVLWIMP